MRWLIYALFIYLLYRLITSSRKPRGEQRRFVGRGAGSLRTAATEGASPHEVLEVEPDASREEIRHAYQQKMREYHPDRVAGAAPEIRDLAEKRSKEINAAYQALTKG